MLRLILVFILGLRGILFGQNLTGQVFMLTEDFLEDKCEVSAQCDCCSTDLFFLTNKDFAMVNRCLHNDSFYKGTYLIKNSKLTLTFKQKEVNEIVDEQTNKKKNEIKKLRIDQYVFTLSKCGNKIRLGHATIKDFKNGARHSLTTEKEKLIKLNQAQAWKLVSE